jgi:hypothetical protein
LKKAPNAFLRMGFTPLLLKVYNTQTPTLPRAFLVLEDVLKVVLAIAS